MEELTVEHRTLTEWSVGSTSGIENLDPLIHYVLWGHTYTCAGGQPVFLVTSEINRIDYDPCRLVEGDIVISKSFKYTLGRPYDKPLVVIEPEEVFDDDIQQ